MAIKQLTDEQVREWSIEQKDRWWFEHVWRGDMPQLTIRSAMTGMLLGGVLSLTNLYVGAKTGWTLGVGITSVILAFALWKSLKRLGFSSEFTILENNCMQSIATAAGYMTAPMISSLAAYMMVTDSIIPMSTTMVWLIALALLGVLFAFPLKRRFINDEQHPFPEGRAAGVVMDALHQGDASEGIFKARLLVLSAALSGVIALLKSHKIIEHLHLSKLSVPHYLDTWLYKYISPRIGGIELRELTVRLEPDIVMMAAGGLMGIRTGVSLLVGATINYLILAPWMIARGDITGKVIDGTDHYGFRSITLWALWCGAAMMTTASLFSFFSRSRIMLDAVRELFKSKQMRSKKSDLLSAIELPMNVFVIGIPLIGTAIVYLGYRCFDVSIWLGIVAIPLVFVFSLIAAYSTALTSITPTGALGKLTQLTYGALAPGNITTNLMAGSITGEVAGNASNLLMDIKPGYMLGAKPRQQAIGHVLGIFAGAVVSVPVFYAVFLRGDPQGLISEQYPMPSATVWKAVAEVLTSGLSQLPVSARWFALIGAIVGIALEVVRVKTRGRFPLSGVGIGLAFVIPFTTCFAMFLGAFLFWLAEQWTASEGRMRRIFVENRDPIAAGLIAGGALIGIAVVLVENFLL